MKITTKKVPLSALRENKDNPRQIDKAEFERLVKSLREFPDMLGIREIVVDSKMTVLGGNMRLRALRQIGVKEVTVKVCHGITDAQRREFIIKDNSAFGEWDWDALANAWDDLPLADWGVDIPDDWAGGEDDEQKETKKKSAAVSTCPKCGHVWNV
jgi:ParB-like chromosome segregation protein Spo0J